ncbi:MAG: hypothetical protein FWF84_07560, partial [Kiritimatiellaeota bacterium]|nr:hypothetical protein [Kiritimatiellota bacterium]
KYDILDAKRALGRLVMVATGELANPALRPTFSGLDRQLVRLECTVGIAPEKLAYTTNIVKDAGMRLAMVEAARKVRDGEIDPVQRRLEYTEAVIRILADPALRAENPLEDQNLRDILFNVLRTDEETLRIIADLRRDGNLSDEQKAILDEIAAAIPTTDALMLRIIANPALRTESPAEFRRLFESLTRYLKPKEDIPQYAEDFKRAHPDLTDDQIAVLDDITSAINSTRY